MEERSHLAIGEVLTLLREEFPDVTISKIRFLESQGLVDPERTPSGYRKFYEGDVARLRWILLQQKENFLPLKVIKDRLAQLDAGGRSDFTTAPSGGAPRETAAVSPASGGATTAGPGSTVAGESVAAEASAGAESALATAHTGVSTGPESAGSESAGSESAGSATAGSESASAGSESAAGTGRAGASEPSQASEPSEAPLGLERPASAAPGSAAGGSRAGTENGAAPEAAGAPAPTSATAAPGAPAPLGGLPAEGSAEGTPSVAAESAGPDPDARAQDTRSEGAAQGSAGPATDVPPGGAMPRTPRDPVPPHSPMPSGAASTGPNFARRSVLGPSTSGSQSRPAPARPEPWVAERGPLVGRGPERRPAERARAAERGRPESAARPGVPGPPPSRGTAPAPLPGAAASSTVPPSGRTGPAAPGGAARERVEGRGLVSRAPLSDEEAAGPARGGPVGMSTPDGETLTLVELAAASGLDVAAVQQLQQFGLIVPTGAVGGTTYFDGLALEVARSAAALGRHGLEARHLKAWRTSAEREASTFEQVIMPLVRQRNPHARAQAEATLDELSGLGADLRAALLRQALRSVR